MITNEWEWIVRLLVAAALGGAVGLERETHGRDAGFRTMMLVCSGTALIMATSLRVPELFSQFGVSSALRIDPARIAYGTISGIGFLGAGAIIRDKGSIRGITTAACLWMVTAIGLAVGCGFYLLGLTSTGISVLILYFLRKGEHFLPRDTYNQVTVVQATEVDLASYLKILQEEKLRVLNHQITVHTPPPVTEISFTIRHRHPNEYLSEHLIRRFLSLPGVKSVSWK